MNRFLLMSALSLSLFGCAAEEAAAPAAPADPPPAAEEPQADPDADLAKLAKAIEADPMQAEALLSAAGYTIDRFEAELVAIAKDPARAAAWSAN